MLCRGGDDRIICVMKYIDVHCHLQNADNIGATLNAAQSVGVCGAICNATAPDDWARVRQIAREYKSVRGAIGVHPWRIHDLSGDVWARDMYDILRDNPDLMIGECGLDKFHPDMSQQLNVFDTQLQMATELGRPVFIHCVGAWDKMFQILKSRKSHLPMIMVAHAFNGSAEILTRLINEYNFYISASPMILDNRRTRLLDAMRGAPINRILIESDGTNPADVISVAGRVADIKNVAQSEIADIIYENTIGIL